MRSRFVVLVAAGFLFGAACNPPPPRGSPEGGSQSGAVTASCAKEGDACLFAPGKLGSCTSKPEPCDPRAGACLVCVSQH